MVPAWPQNITILTDVQCSLTTTVLELSKLTDMDKWVPSWILEKRHLYPDKSCWAWNAPIVFDLFSFRGIKVNTHGRVDITLNVEKKCHLLLDVSGWASKWSNHDRCSVVFDHYGFSGVKLTWTLGCHHDFFSYCKDINVGEVTYRKIEFLW